jgi:hypothetical protein
VSASARSGITLNSLLQVHDPVFGVEIGRLRDGRVGFSLADGLKFPRDAIIADDDDVTGFPGRMQQSAPLERAP